MTQALNPDLVLTLRVARTARAAQDIRRFELVDANGGPLPEFTPGAHLLLQAPGGMTRRYSLCNPPCERDRYVIAVKREANGRGGSADIVDNVNDGDLLYASEPRNEFELSDRAPAFIFIAGGIGITPIHSMIAHLARRGDKPFKLYYLTREADLTAFRDELSVPELRANVVLHHDFGDPDRSFDLWPVLEKPTRAHIYCCGPKALMDSVRDMTGHWPTAAVHFEDFGSRNLSAPEDKPFTVRLGLRGDPIEIPADRSILQVLREHGCKVRSSCESGTCGSCRTRLIAGDADHRDLVLTDAERLHEITVCVSRAHSSELVLDL